MSEPVIVMPTDYLAELVATIAAAHLSLIDFADSLYNGGELHESAHVSCLARDLNQFAADLEDEGTFPRLATEVPA